MLNQHLNFRKLVLELPKIEDNRREPSKLHFNWIVEKLLNQYLDF